MSAIPEGYSTVSVFLAMDDAAKALDFYAKALGAEETLRLPTPDGKGVLHAEMQLGTSRIMLADVSPESGAKTPAQLGGTPASFFIYVEDVDSAYRRATEAGMDVLMELQEMFWGDKMGRLKDPFGYEWALAEKVRDVPQSEVEATLKQMAAG